MSKMRNPALDTLKTVGIFAIILAHCRALPAGINYLRNFEVLLLVLISGALQGDKVFVSARDYAHWVYRRVLRLVLPTWTFLTILFLGIFLAGKLVGQAFPYGWWAILESYLLLGGVGYVWIMSVYCFVAIGTPVLNGAFKQYTLKKKMIALLFLWIGYEVLRFVVLQYTGAGVVHYLLKNVILYMVGYSILSAVGNLVHAEKTAKWWVLAGALLAGHLLLQYVMFQNAGVLYNLNTGKYPLTFGYVSYALGAALVLFLACRTWLPDGLPGAAGRFCEFVGKNSSWIYFHHVFLVFVWNMVIDRESWGAMYLFLCVGALLLVWLQSRILAMLEGRVSPKVQHILQLLFG